MIYELLIQHNNEIYRPAVVEGVEWTTERKGVPGKLTFDVLKTKNLDFTEGDKVSFSSDGEKVFKGYVFEKRRGKDGVIAVTAYDQLRYLKNRDTLNYQNKTATEVIKMIADDYKLKYGALADTGFVIPSRIEENQTLFDIIQTALDLTLQNTGKLYVFYDDYGELTLYDIKDMRVNVIYDELTAQDYDYISSIDGDTYNRIKLVYKDSDAGTTTVYTSTAPVEVKQWGILQYCDELEDNVNGIAKATELLRFYGHKSRKLELKDAYGYVGVRAGTYIPVILNLGDIEIKQQMLVERVTHYFNYQWHTMDLSLRGGLITG